MGGVYKKEKEWNMKEKETTNRGQGETRRKQDREGKGGKIEENKKRKKAMQK